VKSISDTIFIDVEENVLEGIHFKLQVIYRINAFQYSQIRLWKSLQVIRTVAYKIKRAWRRRVGLSVHKSTSQSGRRSLCGLN